MVPLLMAEAEGHDNAGVDTRRTHSIVSALRTVKNEESTLRSIRRNKALLVVHRIQ